MHRIHLANAAYLVTTNTIHRIPFLGEDALAAVVSEAIMQSVAVKRAALIGFKLNPDHIHLIIQVRKGSNISQIMQTIKRVSSTRINQILSYGRPDNTYQCLNWHGALLKARDGFLATHGRDNQHEYPLFRWQKSFHDQLIRNPSHMLGAIDYLRKQHVKHQLPTNRWLYIRDPVPNDIFYPGRPPVKK